MRKTFQILFTLFVICINAFSNDIPGKTELIKVSVDTTTGYTKIYWKQANNAVFYRVYLYKANSNEVIPGSDVLASDPLIYEYKNTIATNQSLGFTVQGYNDAGTFGAWSDPDSTIFLESWVDTCASSVKLTWNSYSSWRGDIERYEVLQMEDGGAWQVVQVVQEPNTTAEIKNIQASHRYDYCIAAIRKSTGDTSHSNKSSVFINMADIPTYIEADYASWHSDGQEISFSVDPNNELSDFELYRSNAKNGKYKLIHTFDEVSEEYKYIDKTDFQLGPYYYMLLGFNYCDNQVVESSNTASTILLKGQWSGESVNLSWNQYENYTAGVSNYQLIRNYGNQRSDEFDAGTSLNYMDSDVVADGKGIGVSEVCYTLAAIEGNGNLSRKQNISTSNTVCLQLPALVRFDYDAFIPGNAQGNNTFGPTMDFLPSKFEMKVFDRNGFVVFKTKDAANAQWTGKVNGAYAPEGIYSCLVVYTDGSGNEKTIQQNVTIVYP
ncbi:MAG: fibronectin type III domain-containing protein [Bacteroidales bacterium]|nr:fibronectin type III domain-containing protein [Bacteroidales bacterium]